MNIQGTTNADRGDCFYTGQWVRNISIHRNLFTGSDHRNPRLNTHTIRVINNVMYNWGNRAGESAHDAIVDYIGNYYKGGPQTTDDISFYRVIHEPWKESCADNPPASLHLAGNIMEPYYKNPSDPYAYYQMYRTLQPLDNKYKRTQPLTPAPVPVKAVPAKAAYNRVLADVGCNAHLDGHGIFRRQSDSVDQRMIDDVRQKTGFDHPINQNDWDTHAVAFPVMDSGIPYTDTDHDGMGDDWEIDHFGNLHTAEYNDVLKTDYDHDGFYDLEEFLNGSDPEKKDSP